MRQEVQGRHGECRLYGGTNLCGTCNIIKHTKGHGTCVEKLPPRPVDHSCTSWDKTCSGDRDCTILGSPYSKYSKCAFRHHAHGVHGGQGKCEEGNAPPAPIIVQPICNSWGPGSTGGRNCDIDRDCVVGYGAPKSERKYSVCSKCVDYGDGVRMWCQPN